MWTDKRIYLIFFSLRVSALIQSKNTINDVWATFEKPKQLCGRFMSHHRKHTKLF